MGSSASSKKRIPTRSDKAEGEDLCLAVLATNPDTARVAKRAGADLVYVPVLNYRRGQSETAGALDRDIRQAGYPKDCILAMPVVDHDLIGEQEESSASPSASPTFHGVSGVDVAGIEHGADNAANRESAQQIDVWEYANPGESLLVESLGGMQHAVELGAVLEIGQHMPIMNAEALRVAHAYGAQRIWLSPELNLHQIRRLSSTPLPSSMAFGVKVAGAQELMVTEHCLLMSEGPCRQDCLQCARRKVPHALRDRKGYLFPVMTDLFGRSHLYNSVELDMVNALPDLIDAGVSAFMVDATLMDAEQTAHATGRLAKAIRVFREGAEPLPKLPGTTAGHLFRGVM